MKNIILAALVSALFLGNAAQAKTTEAPRKPKVTKATAKEKKVSKKKGKKRRRRMYACAPGLRLDRSRGNLCGYTPSPDKDWQPQPAASGYLAIVSAHNPHEKFEGNIYQLNTDGTYKYVEVEGQKRRIFEPESLSALNHLWRCRRTGEEVVIAPRLFEVLSAAQDRYRVELGKETLDTKEFFVLNSGHRKQKQTSYHKDGAAADITIPGLNLTQMTALFHKEDIWLHSHGHEVQGKASDNEAEGVTEGGEDVQETASVTLPTPPNAEAVKPEELAKVDSAKISVENGEQKPNLVSLNNAEPQAELTMAVNNKKDDDLPPTVLAPVPDKKDEGMQEATLKATQDNTALASMVASGLLIPELSFVRPRPMGLGSYPRENFVHVDVWRGDIDPNAARKGRGSSYRWKEVYSSYRAPRAKKSKKPHRNA